MFGRIIAKSNTSYRISFAPNGSTFAQRPSSILGRHIVHNLQFEPILISISFRWKGEHLRFSILNIRSIIYIEISIDLVCIKKTCLNTHQTILMLVWTIHIYLCIAWNYSICGHRLCALTQFKPITLNILWTISIALNSIWKKKKDWNTINIK